MLREYKCTMGNTRCALYGGDDFNGGHLKGRHEGGASDLGEEGGEKWEVMGDVPQVAHVLCDEDDD